MMEAKRLVEAKQLFRNRKAYKIYFVPYALSETGIEIVFLKVNMKRESNVFYSNQTAEIYLDAESLRLLPVDFFQAKQFRPKVTFAFVEDQPNA
jgi:hypothetical protein